MELPRNPHPPVTNARFIAFTIGTLANFRVVLLDFSGPNGSVMRDHLALLWCGFGLSAVTIP
jgi:hypothetical protein